MTSSLYHKGALWHLLAPRLSHTTVSASCLHPSCSQLAENEPVCDRVPHLGWLQRDNWVFRSSWTMASNTGNNTQREISAPRERPLAKQANHPPGASLDPGPSRRGVQKWRPQLQLAWAVLRSREKCPNGTTLIFPPRMLCSLLIIFFFVFASPPCFLPTLPSPPHPRSLLPCSFLLGAGRKKKKVCTVPCEPELAEQV